MREDKRFVFFESYKQSFVFVVVLVLFVCGSALGQSGRKIAKSDEKKSTQTQNDKEQKQESSSSSESKAASSESQSKNSETKKTTFIVASDIIPANVFVRFGWAVKAFKQRMASSPAVITKDEGEIRRKDAIELAKSQEETYVAWVRLDIDAGDTETPAVTTGPIGNKVMMVQYYVFEPKTGKIINQGHISIHLPGDKVKDITVGGTKPGIHDDETLFRQAGRETADRILSDMNLPLPKDK